MPRKKSARDASDRFLTATQEVRSFLDEIAKAKLSDLAQSRAHDQAIMATSVAFEHLMLHCLVAAVNNDTATISQKSGVNFPKHLTDEVCEYLVTGGGYFDFRGREGLTKTVRRFVPESHWLLEIVKDARYRFDLELLIGLRNYVAHDSKQGKAAATKAMKGFELRRQAQPADLVGMRIPTAGAWVKRSRRMMRLLDGLDQLAKEIGVRAPY
jgi:hypothetical protein